MIKIGVIGVGSIGSNHARIYSELRNAELIGVVDTDFQRAGEIASKYGCTAYREISEIMGLVDAVTISVPTTSHFNVAMEFLKRNKDVLVEKPITSTVEEAGELIREADKKNLILQVGHLERFNAGVSLISKLVDKPRLLESQRLAPFQKRGIDVDVTLDLMIHDIDIILSLVKSDITDMRATGSRVLTENIDVAHAWIEFANGCHADIAASRIASEKKRQLEVYQRDSHMILDYQTQEVTHYIKLGGEVKKEITKPDAREPLREQLASFIDCCQRRAKPLVSGAEGKRALELAMKISGMINDEIAG